MTPRVAVVGAGWAGLAAALDLQAGGAEVTVFEASRVAGGRARSQAVRAEAAGAGHRLDNGQHILIGACTHTLALMQRVGVSLEQALHRIPLTMRHADGQGGAAPDGRLARALIALAPTGSALAWAIAAWRGWTVRDKFAVLRWLHLWQRRGFALPPGQADVSLSDLCADLPAAVVRDFIGPLALSALNTPLHQASSRVFLQVLATTLRPDGVVPCGWQGSDLLLPRWPLDGLLPAPALRHLAQYGATLKLGERVTGLAHREGAWRVATPSETSAFNAVVVATPVRVSATLLATVAPDWSQEALRIAHQPIITLYLRRKPHRGEVMPLPWPAPLLALRDSADVSRGQPAQFALDLQALSGQPLIALVISAAELWLEWMRAQGREALVHVLRRQLLAQAGHTLPIEVQQAPEQHLVVEALLCERRATPACVVGQTRPAAQVSTAHGTLHLAGDALDSPWPGTLEGAVRSGEAAARATLQALALCPGHGLNSSP